MVVLSFLNLVVILLQAIDDMFMIPFQSKALGRILFEQVCKQLNLLEVDYFGLEYQDAQGITVSIFKINGACI